MQLKPFFVACILSLFLLSCIEEKSNNINSQEKVNNQFVDSLSFLIQNKIHTYRYTDAERSLEQLLEISVKKDIIYGQLKYHILKGMLHANKNEKREAIKYLNYCIENAYGLNNNILSEAYITLGDIYSELNNTYLAHGYYLEGLDIALNSKDKNTIRIAYSRVALVLFKQKQFRESREYFTKSLELFKSTSFTFPDYFKVQELLNNIGLTFFEEKDYEMADYYYRLGLNEIEKLKSDTSRLYNFSSRIIEPTLKNQMIGIAKGVVMGNLGRIFLKKGELDSARYYLQENVQINLKPDWEIKDATLSLLYLMECELIKKNYDKFLAHSKVVDKIIQEHDFRKLKIKHKELLSAYYLKTGQIKLALDNQLAYQTLKDSIFENSKEVMIADIPTVYLLLKKSNAMEVLEKEKEFKELRYNILIVFAIIILLSAILLGLYLYKEVKRKNSFKALNKQLEIEQSKLKYANADLNALNREKTIILGVVAHDLRNPINIIKGFGDLMMDDQNLDEMNKKGVSYILQSCNKALDTINDLVEVARQGIEVEIDLKPSNFNDLVEKTIEGVKDQADKKQISLEFKKEADQLIANINEPKMQRLIDNLISNAIKFTNKEGLVKISTLIAENKLIFAVEDNGIGIPDHMKEVIFDRFTKASRYGTSGEVSLGLGMSIVKTIVDQHKGQIQIESEEKKGTRFKISIPL